jgi:enoyl-CoA hydratase/carnithine racemase
VPEPSSPQAVDPATLSFERVRYTKTDGIATVAIDRPRVLNCFDFATLRELGRAFEDASWDDGIAVVVVTGTGDRAFCTGADLDEQASMGATSGQYWRWMGAFVEMHDRLRNIGKPTIARINGICVGGGNELQMACDLSVMSDDAYIRHVGPEHGSVPAGGATQWLPIIVGERRAREIVMLCEEIPAGRALEWGLVTRAVPRSELDAAVAEIAASLRRKLPETIRYTKTQLNWWRDLVWSQTVSHARDWLAVHSGSDETREAVAAFHERRQPRYDELRAMQAAPRSCQRCGATGMPAGHAYCGVCGAPLDPAWEGT